MDRMILLETLLDREQRRRDAALAEWQAAQQQADSAREQCEALQVYRVEYRKRWSAQFQQGATMEILRCYQGFVERLDQAIVSQQGSSLQADQRVVLARDRLRQRETRVAMVRKLMERRRHAHVAQIGRREQKAADEAAQRMGWAARQQTLSAA
jgi:flagellar protein FliJ